MVETDAQDVDRPRGVLSTADRKYLQATEAEREENYSRQARAKREEAIRERTQNAIRDFQVLSNTLSPEECAEMSVGEPGTIERRVFEGDMAAVIQFLYVALGGATGFRRPLKIGVANGEASINQERYHALDLGVRFAIDPIREATVLDVADLIEAEEWDRLDSPDLLAFLSAAERAGAIDFEKFRDDVGYDHWSQEYVLGKKRRAIPGGKSTPRMDPDVFDREGIGDMTPDELRELFNGGYPSGLIILYDGEKVFRPPPPGGDEEEMEVLQWINRPDEEE